MKRIKRGDIISCPECAKHLLRCNERPQMGSTDYEKYFEDIGWGGKHGDLTLCPGCGATWMKTGAKFEVHVAGKGWLNG